MGLCCLDPLTFKVVWSLYRRRSSNLSFFPLKEPNLKNICHERIGVLGRRYHNIFCEGKVYLWLCWKKTGRITVYGSLRWLGLPSTFSLRKHTCAAKGHKIERREERETVHFYFALAYINRVHFYDFSLSWGKKTFSFAEGDARCNALFFSLFFSSRWLFRKEKKERNYEAHDSVEGTDIGAKPK